MPPVLAPMQAAAGARAAPLRRAATLREPTAVVRRSEDAGPTQGDSSESRPSSHPRTPRMALQDDNDAAFELGGGEQKGVVPPAACSTPTPAVFFAGFLSAGCGLILSLSLLPQLESYGDGVVHACVYLTPCPAGPDARWRAHAYVTRVSVAVGGVAASRRCKSMMRTARARKTSRRWQLTYLKSWPATPRLPSCSALLGMA